MSGVLRKELLTALRQKYKYEIQHGKATMLVYLNHSMGIGEHPQHVEEMDMLLEKMASANDKLSTLSKHFPDKHETPNPPGKV